MTISTTALRAKRIYRLVVEATPTVSDSSLVLPMTGIPTLRGVLDEKATRERPLSMVDP